VGAHIVLGAGDQPMLDAVAKHLPGPFGPITTVALRRNRTGTRRGPRDRGLGELPGAPEAAAKLTEDALELVS
jgi:hypothetical protein